MTPLGQFVALLVVHWIADFVLQSHWMASNKSKSMEALWTHVAFYTGALLVGSALIFGLRWGLGVFAVVNGALHFSTDYYTSRLSSRLWAQQRWHDFFVVIGFDQLLHQITLAATMWLILGAIP